MSQPENELDTVQFAAERCANKSPHDWETCEHCHYLVDCLDEWVVLASRAPATTPTPLAVKVINSVRTWSVALDPQVVQAEIDMTEAIREYDAPDMMKAFTGRLDEPPKYPAQQAAAPGGKEPLSLYKACETIAEKEIENWGWHNDGARAAHNIWSKIRALAASEAAAPGGKESLDVPYMLHCGHSSEDWVEDRQVGPVSIGHVGHCSKCHPLQDKPPAAPGGGELCLQEQLCHVVVEFTGSDNCCACSKSILAFLGNRANANTKLDEARHLFDPALNNGKTRWDWKDVQRKLYALAQSAASEAAQDKPPGPRCSHGVLMREFCQGCEDAAPEESK